MLTAMPEWKRVLVQLKKSLDIAHDRVITAAERGTIEEIRYASGRYTAVKSLYDTLEGLK
jgi:hypothetical protein